jgi:RHS repeat-associated protein
LFDDPFNRTNYLYYDGNGLLTNITDVVGLASTFAYDPNGWITNLSTPYGNTIFRFTGANTANFTSDPYDTINRSAEVTLPGGGRHLYLYRDVLATVIPGVSEMGLGVGGRVHDSSNVPESSTTPIGVLDNGYMQNRNSFSWSPRQYALLSTTNITSMGTNDYGYSTWRHWLHDYNGSLLVSGTLSMERTPTLDGVTNGKMTWYDYVNKEQLGGYIPTFIGANGRIDRAVILRILPDGSTWYEHYQRDILGHATNVITTYTSNTVVVLRTNQFTYVNNDLVKGVDASGVQVLSNLYTTSHLVATNWDALNQVTRYFYNGNNQLTGASYPNGLTQTNSYFTSGTHTGFLASVSYPDLGATTSYTYTNNLVFTATDPRGLTVTNYYDSLQRLTGQSFSSDGGGTNTGTTNIYAALDLTAHKDRMQRWAYFGYDAERRITAVTNTIGAVTRYGYCACGSLDYVTNAFGTAEQQVTHFTYDNLGRLSAIYLPDGTSSTNIYDSVGRLIAIADGRGTNHFVYNNQGLLTLQTNSFGQLLKLEYDVNDRVISRTDANGVQTTNTFDALGRLLTRTQPAIAAVESFGYTAKGLVAYTNPLAKIWRYDYDLAGRKTYETNANIEVTQFAYNSAGDLRTLSDGANHTTAWGFDLEGRITSKTNANGSEILRLVYDKAGLATNRWTAGKGTNTLQYNAVGGLTNVIYGVSPGITLKYDVRQRLTNMTDAVGTTIYRYNTSGELISEDGPWDNDTITYTYNNRLRSSLTLLHPYSQAWAQTYAYDNASRLTNTTSSAGAFNYSYANPGGSSASSRLVSKLLLPNGAYITNTYDAHARLTGTFLKDSGNSILNSHSYGYNAGHQRISMTNFAGNYWSYTYDNSGQLKTATGSESGGTARLQEKLGYAYDPAGNLQYRTNNGLIQTFNVNTLNQISSLSRSGTLTVAGTTTSSATNVTVNGSTANRYNDANFALDGFTLTNGNNTFTAIAMDSLGRSDTNSVSVNLPATPSSTSDANGNLTSDGNIGYEYDDQNQLIRLISTNSWKSEFIYDGRQRLRIRKEYLWKNSVWVQSDETRYVYDGMLVIEERDANNVSRVTYTRGTDLAGTLQRAGGIGGLLARTDHLSLTPNHSFYHSDANGNVTALADEKQLIAARYNYDPYGNILSESGLLTDANVYRFSSKEFHRTSGLSYYGYRWYSPAKRRWISQDPLSERADINLYRYVGNMPAHYADSDGRLAVLLAPAVVTGLEIAASAIATVAASEVIDRLSGLFSDLRLAAGPEPGPEPLPLPQRGTVANDKEFIDSEGNVRDRETGEIVRDKDGRTRKSDAADPCATDAAQGKVHIDIGGEGRYRNAINLNPRTTTTTTGESGQPIPNLVQGVGENAPFKNGVADLITVENTPLREGSPSEIARILKPGGEVRLVHPADYAASAHQQVINAVGGTVHQTTDNGTTTTIIIGPPLVKQRFVIEN